MLLFLVWESGLEEHIVPLCHCSDDRHHDIIYISEAYKLLFDWLKAELPERGLTTFFVWSDGAGNQFKQADSLLLLQQFFEW